MECLAIALEVCMHLTLCVVVSATYTCIAYRYQSLKVVVLGFLHDIYMKCHQTMSYACFIIHHWVTFLKQMTFVLEGEQMMMSDPIYWQC